MSDLTHENEPGLVGDSDGAPTSVNSTALTDAPIMGSPLVTRAQLARMAGVTRAAVTQLCGKRLAPGCSGRFVDTSHPAVAAWLGSPHPVPGVATPEQRRQGALRRLQVLSDAELEPLADDVLGLVRRLLASRSAERVRLALSELQP